MGQERLSLLVIVNLFYKLKLVILLIDHQGDRKMLQEERVPFHSKVLVSCTSVLYYVLLLFISNAKRNIYLTFYLYDWTAPFSQFPL